MVGGEGESTSESRSDGVIPGEKEVNVQCSNGSKFSVRTSLHSSVTDFKALLARNCDVPALHQRLIYKGLQADHTVHMARGSAPVVGPKPPADTSGAGNISTTPGVTQGVGSNERGGTGSAGPAASLFPGIGFGAVGGAGGASGFSGAGLPDFEHVQQQLTQNPNMMREIMTMPVI